MSVEGVVNNMEQILMDIKQELAEHREQIKGALKRIDEQAKLTESVHKLATAIEVLTAEQKSVIKKLDRVSSDVETIKAKPAKKWEEVTKTVVTVIVTAVVTYFLTKSGIK